MGQDDHREDRNSEPKVTKAGKMLSVEQVEQILRREAEAFGKRFEKWDDPEEFKKWFNRVIEQVEREGLDGPSPHRNDDPWLYEEDARLSNRIVPRND